MATAINLPEGRKVSTFIDGRALAFTRRRYGKTTYTWVFVWDGTQWVDLGDPWPVLSPKHSELKEAIARKVKE
jgi:hypothetical protein